MARKNSLSFFKTLSTILFLVIIFLCIQYYVGRGITASNNSFKDMHWTTEKKYFIELEQLDGVFFHITINGVIDKNDELFIEIKNAKEDKRHVIKLEKPRNKHQCYYRLYFSTITQCEKLPQKIYMSPGKYTFHIECKSHEERIMKEGELLIGYFCKIKYLRYYKRQQIPYLRVREINNNDTPIQGFSKKIVFEDDNK